MTAGRLKMRYAVTLAFAQLIAALELAVLIMPMRHQMVPAARTVFSGSTLIAAAALTAFGLSAIVLYVVTVVTSRMRWLADGTTPDLDERRFVRRLIPNQSILLASLWAISGVVFFCVNRQGGAPAAWLIVLGMLLGTTTSTGAALLLVQRPMHRLMAAVGLKPDGRDTAPGVLARLLGMWLVFSALPIIGIAVVVLMWSRGWILEKTAPVQTPVLVLVVISLLVGLRGIMIAAISISDPVREVVAAMARVERGEMDTRVDVYERSEIGRLQSGFNRMVEGLTERDRLHDLFGRHVGPDVARRAVAESDTLTGQVCEAGVLFVDLVGSTQLTQTRPPAEVAAVLNLFFRIVVAAVDEHEGSINKFQGDAVLAVFGAPLSNPDSASDALRTARALAVRLKQLRLVDFGIGVSAGPVFAGNIGAEHRYEYTVIGDAVNEAARLADRAKGTPDRAVCSQDALMRADSAEHALWRPLGSEVLKGRRSPTKMSAPIR